MKKFELKIHTLPKPDVSPANTDIANARELKKLLSDVTFVDIDIANAKNKPLKLEEDILILLVKRNITHNIITELLIANMFSALVESPTKLSISEEEILTFSDLMSKSTSTTSS